MWYMWWRVGGSIYALQTPCVCWEAIEGFCIMSVMEVCWLWSDGLLTALGYIGRDHRDPTGEHPDQKDTTFWMDLSSCSGLRPLLQPFEWLEEWFGSARMLVIPPSKIAIFQAASGLLLHSLSGHSCGCTLAVFCLWSKHARRIGVITSVIFTMGQ